MSRQAVHYASQFVLLEPELIRGNNRIGLSYFHGAATEDDPNLRTCYESLRQHSESINRIHVSNTTMLEMVLNAGISPQRVSLIPIGVNLASFVASCPESRDDARRRLGIPRSAMVVGSFQKDGVGWGEGLEPKMIKGPDVFLKVVEILRNRVPELYVLLSGPARGFVKAGLQRLGIPFHHVFLADYREIGELYHAIDLYLVSSRDEGGPKAVLESMASGVPLVTTRVGQAVDLVRHGDNGWIVDVGDTESLMQWAQYVLENRNSLGELRRRARKTAEENSYERQLPLWEDYLTGFVGPPPSQ